MILRWGALAALLAIGVGCTEDADTSSEGNGGHGAATTSNGGGGHGATGSGGSGAAGASGPGCDLAAAVPPWPSWVPEWPGEGRNASGNTTFWALTDGATIGELEVVDITASSAVVQWTTPGQADSSVGWGTAADLCPTGYHRTGGRRTHRLAMGPLEPATEYFVTVRSRDDASEDRAMSSFTTAALPPATELSACATIDAAGDYRVVADLQADCTCLAVLADGVRLDLGWHTIRYAETSSSEQCHGVAIDANDVAVARGIVEQGTAGGDLYSHAVRIYGADAVRVEQLWLHVHTADAFGLRAMYSSDVTIRQLLLVSEVQDVTNRHYPGNHGIGLHLDNATPAEVSDCALFGVPHWGISISTEEEQGPAAAEPLRRLSGNHIFADMHATNGYAIGIHGADVEVDHNEIRPLHNGRAVHYTHSGGWLHHNIIEAVELVAGDPAQGYAYYSDLADSASPHDAEVCGWVVAHGIRIEGGSLGLIENNEVYGFSLPSVSFGATGLNINTEAGGLGGNEVRGNQLTAHQADGSLICGGGLPMRAGWVWGEAPLTPASLHDNRFVSSGETLLIADPSLATSTNDELVQQ